MHKVWASDAAKEGLQGVLGHSHSNTLAVLRQYTTSLESGTAKMKARLATNGWARLSQLQQGTAEEMKGTTCVHVQQRWTTEDQGQHLDEDAQNLGGLQSSDFVNGRFAV
ncbi:hypothetical protein DOTSEDRAFT_30875 [Dothistroma septosporum NZE10]|uniref:Uncharacterized protein n=1 Tax=Dothistroma septosporum (strain NZE10 / CBS 128990) TaxID=675120 RepID=N1Q1X7_DOTSN|nr:hypothetical protein DOTSEDRAFT_30875 [Dothistroma septosporum NZE10]